MGKNISWLINEEKGKKSSAQHARNSAKITNAHFKKMAKIFSKKR